MTLSKEEFLRRYPKSSYELYTQSNVEIEKYYTSRTAEQISSDLVLTAEFNKSQNWSNE